jgi:diacylglycerol O-acyltransferase/trehalose O-mycolyltransferase
MDPRYVSGVGARAGVASCALAASLAVTVQARASICSTDGACVTAQSGATASAAATKHAAGAACPTSSDARYIDLQITSPSLPAVGKVRLLVPADWSATASRTWPVLYLLNGHGNSFRAWSCAARVEAYVANAEVIVVMPDGTTGYDDADPPDSLSGGTPSWYSNWLSGSPAWETFHTQELPQILANGFRASSTSAVAGLSMGGFGALSYAARHVGMFSAAAAYSGLLDTLNSVGTDVIQASLVLAGQSENALWGDPTTSQESIWMQHNPDDLAADLAQLPMFVSAGNGSGGPFDSGFTIDATEAGVLAVTQDFISACSSAGCAHLTTDLYGNGTHNWPYWDAELCRSLPMLMAAEGVSYTATVTCPTP